MKILLDRFGFGADSTIGRLVIPGVAMCFTLEDERRRKKVWGETCIPEGTYEVTLRREGGFHGRYSRKFPDLHKGMLWLQDVPDFQFILIHIGNGDDDTAGCILVGEDPAITSDGEFRVLRSTDAYRRIYSELAAKAAAGELEIEIRDIVPAQ